MRIARRAAPEPAPLTLRVAAGILDVAIVLPLYLGYVAVRNRGSKTSLLDSFPSRRFRGSAFATVVILRNVRGAGLRGTGLHRVDARTGGPVSLRSALVRKLIMKLAFDVTGRIGIGAELGLTVGMPATALLSRDRRTVVDRIAGVALVTEPRRRR